MATAHSDSAAGRALWLSTIAFTVCFAVWTIFSIIGVQIKKDLGLNDTAVRPARRHADPHRQPDPPRSSASGPTSMAAASSMSRSCWRRRSRPGSSPSPTTTRPSCSRRSASASPADRSPSASPMCRAGIPAEKQGTALGIFGAGNVGAAVTKFLAPARHGRLRLEDGGGHLGARPRRHGGRLLVRHQGRSRTRRSGAPPG